MEGDRVFGYEISAKNINSPPVSAIDRFLCGKKNKEMVISGNGVSEFYPNNNNYCSFYGSHVSITSGDYENVTTYNGFILKSFSGRNFIDGIETPNWDNHMNLLCQKEEKYSRRVTKSGYSSQYLIKGQWTHEEDRKLIRLVKQFGIKKWAQIAGKMSGRAGKQCRERWHNHLRPDIKKDNWNEEEEKMLIEAHQRLGNKWADIAKQIPGRTENSVKNHWNATKRRQNSSRKSKKNDNKNGKYSKPSLLQNYIKTNVLQKPTTSTSSTHDSMITTSNNISSPSASKISEEYSSIIFSPMFPQSPSEHDSTWMITQTCEDESKFIQHLFATTESESCIADHHGKIFDDDNTIMCINDFSKEVKSNVMTKPDHYFASLVDGVTGYKTLSTATNNYDN